MAGSRYADWHHLRIFGNEDAAMAVLPYARKLLGYAMQQGKASNLGVATIRKRLEDGTLIVAEMIGQQPRITISTIDEPVEQEDIDVFDGFLCWPRTLASPNGVDAVYPQQVLSPPSVSQSWASFLYDRFAGYWEAIKGKKHAYKQRNGADFLPSGLRFYGNVDWESGEGIRISWKGASTRYWPDPGLVTGALWDTKIFHYGRVILDTDTYEAQTTPTPNISQRYIKGAALRFIDGQWWLYAMQSDLQANHVYPRFVAQEPQPPDVQVSLSVYRYRVDRDTSGQGLPAAKVVLGSHELVWSQVVDEAIGPWFFNQSCTEAVSYSFPTVWQGVALNLPLTPSAHNRLTLTIDAGVLVSESISVTAVDFDFPETAIASDYDGDTRIDMTIKSEGDATTNGIVYTARIGDHSYILTGYANSSWDISYFAHVDIRKNLLAIQRYRYSKSNDLRIDDLLVTVELLSKNTSHAQVTYGPWTSDINAMWANRIAPFGMNVSSGAPFPFFVGNAAPFFLVYRQGSAGYVGLHAHHRFNVHTQANAGTTYGAVAVGFSSDRADESGNIDVGCIAMSGSASMISTPAPKASNGDDSAVFSNIKESLEGLTGMAGNGFRAHPITVLGRPIFVR